MAEHRLAALHPVDKRELGAPHPGLEVPHMATCTCGQQCYAISYHAARRVWLEHRDRHGKL